MSFDFNATNRPGAIVSDSPQLSRSINEDTKKHLHDCVDTVKPHVATTMKIATSGVILTGVTIAGNASQASVQVSYPELSPAVNMAVDAGKSLVTGVVTQVISPLVDTGVEKSADVAKEALDKSVDSSGGSSANLFSFFKK